MNYLVYYYSMNALEQLKERENKRIIEKKYIEEVLQEEARNIRIAQDEVFADHKSIDVGLIKAKRQFLVSNSTLTYKHHIRQRFNDMRFIKGKSQKPIPTHNKVIWGHFNNIIFKMAYGFTHDVKLAITKRYNINL